MYKPQELTCLSLKKVCRNGRSWFGCSTLSWQAKANNVHQTKAAEAYECFRCFKEIASISGSKSQDKKCGAIKKLLVDSKGLEAKYIIRGLQGKLRIGMSEQTVLKALAMAFSMTSTTKLDRRVGMNQEKFKTLMEANEINLKQAFSEIPSFDAIVPGLLQGGCEKINEICQLTAGIPVKPMLAKPTKGFLKC